MRVYVVRHGEAGDDDDDAYGGAADYRLTDRGREQATETAASLSSAGIVQIYSSPLSRASESAQIIAATLPGTPPVTVVDGLRERNSYGVLSGVTKAKAKELFGYILDQLQEKPGYSREPLLGAEDFDEFLLRVRAAFDEVIRDAQAAGHESIALVTHGKFTRGLAEHVLLLGDVDLDLSSILAVDYTPFVANVVTEA
ncbi:histidine phosphatase family protein [Ornithinimicrobium sp. LYQ103]|uniref:histidine phosphatase family protein n=1 Tax=unclassified Ornithinimicrobium TaxID=2615080 RepID=UPI0038542A61